MKKILSLILALALVLSMTAIAGAEDVKDLPRNETLYFAGQQWGSVNQPEQLHGNCRRCFRLPYAGV